MLKWIIWNRTVFEIEIWSTLNWNVYDRIVLTFNCVWTISVFLLNWISWIRTAWLIWIAWNRIVFHNQTVYWITWNTTEYLHKMDLALNNKQRLICHKTLPTKRNCPILNNSLKYKYSFMFTFKCKKNFYFKQFNLS